MEIFESIMVYSLPERYFSPSFVVHHSLSMNNTDYLDVGIECT